MKKLLMSVLVFGLLTSVVYPAEIMFNIPDEKLPRVIDALKGVYAIPQIPDPEWVNPEDGSEAPLIPEFTENQWAKECVLRFVRRTVHRYEARKAIDDAKQGIGDIEGIE